MIFIYGLHRPGGKVIYVGASSRPRARLRHKRNAWKIYDLQVKILAETDVYNWGKDEQYWIKKLKPSRNRRHGGCGGVNWKPKITKAFREKKSRDARRAWRDPKKRRNLLARNKARWSDPEQMKKHIAKHTGAKRSSETRQRISKAMKKSHSRRQA
jgi:hypothetical protein